MQASILTDLLLPLAIGIVMLGLGLSLTIEDFRRVARYPLAVGFGLFLQVLLLQRELALPEGHLSLQAATSHLLKLC